MSDLLAHAAANSGSFHHFFKSKEALLKAALEEYSKPLRPRVMEPAFRGTLDPLERIYPHFADYCRYGRPLGRLALEIDLENHPAHRLIAETSGDGSARCGSGCRRGRISTHSQHTYWR